MISQIKLIISLIMLLTSILETFTVAEAIFFAINSLRVFKILISSIIKLTINSICDIITLASDLDCVSSPTIISTHSL